MLYMLNLFHFGEFPGTGENTWLTVSKNDKSQEVRASGQEVV